MPDLRPGDEVIVETADATYTYVLDTESQRSQRVVHSELGDRAGAGPTRGAVRPAGHARPSTPINPPTALITLTTCSELFHTDNRLVAFGHLVSTTPK